MQFRTRQGFAIASFALFLSLAHASATTLTWSTYAGWSPNVSGITELNFSSINAGSGNYSTAAGKTLTPLSGPALPFVFTGPTSGAYQLTGYSYGRSNVVSLAGPSGGAGNITVTMPTGGENALLLGLGTIGGATSLTITLSDAETFTVAATAGSNEFLGLSLSHPISWLTISSSSQSVVNDFYFGTSKLSQDSASQTSQTSPVPEASTLALMGGSLLLLGCGLTRRLSGPAAI